MIWKRLWKHLTTDQTPPATRTPDSPVEPPCCERHREWHEDPVTGQTRYHDSKGQWVLVYEKNTWRSGWETTWPTWQYKTKEK